MLAALLLNACGAQSVPLANHLLPGVAERPAAGYKQLYKFEGSNGSSPTQLTFINDTIYGATMYGGTSSGGTLFTVSEAGKVSTVYNFTGGSDGGEPGGALVPLGKNLYGTAYDGGTGCPNRYGPPGCGVVYALSQSGKVQTAYTFQGGSKDGSHPNVGLVAIKGTLYGTTFDGYGSGCNTYGCGTIFSLSATGKETVIRHFTSRPAYWPLGLVQVAGKLYGIAQGTPATCDETSCGAVFEATTTGSEKTLHQFHGGSDGAGPSSIVALNGILYGTTASGGNRTCNGGYCGTVFSITTSGSEQVIYTFGGAKDGGYPTSLFALGGKLYGTTLEGGGKCDCGTVFTVTPSGTEETLYAFKGEPDGSTPAGLAEVSSVLYGSTMAGGASGSQCLQSGCGTIFRLTP